MLSREKTKTDDQRQDVNDYPVKEQYVLSRLLPEYVSLYRIDLNSGKYEILRLDANTNARQLAEKDPHPPENFDEYVRRYADNFILDEEKEEFIDWHLCANMKRRLLHEEKFTYHYHSVSKEGKDSYYEAYVVKGKTDDETFDAFLGYRNIDSILYKEKEIQEKLQKALNEARLGNEIISSIARTYQYISRIDIQADYFEEISNRDVEHLKYIHSGTLSENNKRVCRGLVAEEYQDAFEKFTDISTLPERMKDEESVVMEYRMKDGSWHSLRFIEKKRDETGRLTHVLCAIRSISDAKRREQTLIYQVAEAKKDAAVKTRFLSNMSHDIRTPMNAIVGFSGLLEKNLQNEKKAKEYLGKIQSSSNLLLMIINQILEMARIESGTAALQLKAEDMDALFHRVNTVFEEDIRKKNLQYYADLDIRHHYVVCDQTKLQEIMLNIISNAIKYTPEGHSIHVEIHEAASENPSKIHYIFSCEDTGIGMSEEYLPHIYEEFSREHSTTENKVPGTGLGLPIIKSMIELMGGSIQVESRQGIGTKFTIDLSFDIALKEEVYGSEDTIESSAIHTIKGKRILLVEDNELNAEIAKTVLEDVGALITRAENGQQALELFKEKPAGTFDAILMDLMMPVMDGYTATRKIRELERSDAKTVPIIAMTANAFQEDAEKCIAVGMNAHLAKPLDIEKMKNTIKDICP